jgi:triacylglycerol esterase/lipase EstA (alpha/beta hydrolase family)
MNPKAHRLLAGLASVVAFTASTILLTPAAHAAGGVNDASCVPTAAHPDPVVILHGLGATYYEDLNVLQQQLANQGYCTFAATYGAYPGFPWVGGLQPIADSAAQIKGQILQVLAETGAAKVDIVGHSEGGFQSLYVTKTQGISDRIGTVVAIAPPTHGTTFGGLVNLAYLFGVRSLVSQALQTFGCPACDNLIVGGSAVQTLNNGPIAQPGVHYTVITSRYDELVTPTDTAFVNEPGVTNEYLQDFCPFDPVGHLNEAYDANVWNLVTNALDPAHASSFTCLAGSPG